MRIRGLETERTLGLEAARTLGLEAGRTLGLIAVRPFGLEAERARQQQLTGGWVSPVRMESPAREPPVRMESLARLVQGLVRDCAP